MGMLLDVIKFISAHFNEIVTALIAFMSGVIAVSLLIPGAEPETTLQRIVDFLKKISIK